MIDLTKLNIKLHFSTHNVHTVSLHLAKKSKCGSRKLSGIVEKKQRKIVVMPEILENLFKKLLAKVNFADM